MFLRAIAPACSIIYRYRRRLRRRQRLLHRTRATRVAGKTRDEQDGSGSCGILILTDTGSPRSERRQVPLSYYGSLIRGRDLVFLLFHETATARPSLFPCDAPS